MKSKLNQQEEIAMKCNHIPYSEETTLIQGKRKQMVLPRTEDFFCITCKETFRFSVDTDGVYHLICEKEEDNNEQ